MEWQTLQLRSNTVAPSGTAASDTVAIETQPATIPDRHTKADLLFMIALLFIGFLKSCGSHVSYITSKWGIRNNFDAHPAQYVHPFSLCALL
jgi:hypothetical protein